MSHSLDRLRFYNEDPDIGLFIWRLGSHVHLHLDFVTIPELRELSTAIYADLQKIIQTVSSTIDEAMEDILAYEVEDIVIIEAITLEIDTIGDIDWTPAGQLKERLEALARHNNEIYLLAIRSICADIITPFTVGIIAPFCRDAPVDNQCVLNMIGQVPSVN